MQTLADIKVAPGSVGVLAPNTRAKVIGPEGQGERPQIIPSWRR